MSVAHGFVDICLTFTNFCFFFFFSGKRITFINFMTAEEFAVSWGQFVHILSMTCLITVPMLRQAVASRTHFHAGERIVNWIDSQILCHGRIKCIAIIDSSYLE